MATLHRFLAAIWRLVRGGNSLASIEARLSAEPTEFAAPEARWHIVIARHSHRDLLRATLFADGSGILRLGGGPAGPAGPAEPLPLSIASELFILLQLHFPIGFADEDRKSERLNPTSLLAVHRRSSPPIVVGFDSPDAPVSCPPTAASRLASLLIQAARATGNPTVHNFRPRRGGDPA